MVGYGGRQAMEGRGSLEGLRGRQSKEERLKMSKGKKTKEVNFTYTYSKERKVEFTSNREKGG